MRNIKIVSTAKYLPKKIVSDKDLDEKMGLKPGWVAKKSGVLKRHFVDDETGPSMGAIACLDVLKKAGLTMSDVDALICTSGTPSQPIPSNASLILEALGNEYSGITAFDINSTCLSFVVGFDVISYMLAAGRFNRVLVVSSEVASVGLNYNEKESASLMGDGAAAVILERATEEEGSRILCSKFESYPEGARFAEIRGGGSLIPPLSPIAKETDFMFKMDGRQIFKLASKLLVPFFERLLYCTEEKLNDYDLVIPHQASRMALKLTQQKLKLTDEQFYIYVEDHGNCISASIPMGIHNAIEDGRLKRGDKVMLLGTSAGFAIGGLGFVY